MEMGIKHNEIWELEWEGMGNHLNGNGNCLHSHWSLFPRIFLIKQKSEKIAFPEAKGRIDTLFCELGTGLNRIKTCFSLLRSYCSKPTFVFNTCTLHVRHTVMNSSYIQLYRCVYGNGNGREWEC